jgi:hypothetical protein
MSPVLSIASKMWQHLCFRVFSIFGEMAWPCALDSHGVAVLWGFGGEAPVSS